MANIKALDRPLSLGDTEQIAAVKAFAEGQVACEGCGKLCDPDPAANEMQDDYCTNCSGDRTCDICGSFYWNREDVDDSGVCWLCRNEEEEADELDAENKGKK